MQGLKLSFVPNVLLVGVFIISIDSSHIYPADSLLAYMQDPENVAMPQAVGSFITIDVEFERDTSDKLDDFLADPNRTDHAALEALQDAFLADLDKLIGLIRGEFNDKPHDLTEFYTVKGASEMVDLRTHAQVSGTGLQRSGVQGVVGNGLSFDGHGYVSYVAQSQSASPTIYVDPNSPFVLTEFQTRGGDNINAILDPDEVFTDPNDPDLTEAREDWIEIQNVSGSEQSLDGWELRDNGHTWPFLSGVPVPAGGCLIVFADNEENPTDSDPPLHSNFQISGNGEYLALVAPDDTIATAYGTLDPPSAPSVPDSEYDVSYGIAWNGSTWVEGLFNASPGQPNEGIYRRVPMDLGNTNFTISLWLKTSTAGVAILSKSDNDGALEDGEKQLYLTASGRVRYYCFIGGLECKIVGNTAVTDGNWNHIAITYGPTTTGKVYLDGVDNTDYDNTDFEPMPDPAEARLFLGYDTSSLATGHFIGVMDEVAIWARRLSATEIANIHAAGLLGIGLDTRAQLPSELLFHASMDVFLEPTPEGETKYKKRSDLLP